MHKYAAVTALAIVLNVTLLTLSVSADCWPVGRSLAPVRPLILSEGECERWGHDWGAVRCHCSFDCTRHYQYTVRMHCTPGRLGCDEGVCDQPVVALEAARACIAKCVKAKEAAQR
jgi:hypothetical protein